MQNVQIRVGLSWWTSFSTWAESLQLARLHRGLDQAHAMQAFFSFSFVFLLFYKKILQNLSKIIENQKNAKPV